MKKLALREIRILGDDLLRKKSREVTEVNEKIRELLDDMVETMIEFDGVGLAAPQIGILKRIIVVMKSEKEILKLINPEILEQEGQAIDGEGCLSVKKKTVKVARPTKIKVKALNENGEEITFIAEDFFARVICHEVDHLNGILIVDKAV